MLLIIWSIKTAIFMVDGSLNSLFVLTAPDLFLEEHEVELQQSSFHNRADEELLSQYSPH